MTRSFFLALCAMALVGCGQSSGDKIRAACVRGETGGEFTSNVDGEGRLYYTCPNGPPWASGCATYGAKDARGNPLYVCS